MRLQPTGPAGSAVFGRIGQNNDAGNLRDLLQGEPGPLGDGQVVSTVAEKVVEKSSSLVDRQACLIGQAVDVLEKGKALDPQFVALARNITAKTFHEPSDHLVHIDNSQGGTSTDLEARGQIYRSLIRHKTPLRICVA